MLGMNPKDQWAAVDRYLNDLLVRPDPARDAVGGKGYDGLAIALVVG